MVGLFWNVYSFTVKRMHVQFAYKKNGECSYRHSGHKNSKHMETLKVKHLLHAKPGDCLTLCKGQAEHNPHQ